ncbi:hypothetical protein YB2330_004152 [Saitoella coloradoensis]
MVGPSYAPIKTESEVFSLSLHPTEDLITVAQLTGHVACYRYTDDGAAPVEVWKAKRHKKSSRGVQFTDDGLHLVSIGRDRVIKKAATETGRVVAKMTDAHDDAINALTIMSETLIATGDDSGCVKFWDERKPGKAVREYVHHFDYISSLQPLDAKILVATSGDASLSVLDIRKGAFVAQSEDQEDDLTSCALVKNGRKLVVGQAEGVCTLFNVMKDNSQWGDHVDRIPGHPGSIDAMIAIDQDRVVTGCSDGIVRILNIQPNKFNGVLGAHEEGMGVECMDLMRGGEWVASGGGSEVLFHRIEADEEDEDKRDRTNDSDSDDDEPRKKKKKGKKMKDTAKPKNAFFAGLD